MSDTEKTYVDVAKVQAIWARFFERLATEHMEKAASETASSDKNHPKPSAA